MVLLVVLLHAISATVGLSDKPEAAGLPLSLLWATPLLELHVNQEILNNAYTSVASEANKWQDESSVALPRHLVPVARWTSILRDCALDLFDAFQTYASDRDELSSDGASPQQANEVGAVPAACFDTVPFKVFHLRRPSSGGSEPP